MSEDLAWDFGSSVLIGNAMAADRDSGTAARLLASADNRAEAPGDDDHLAPRADAAVASEPHEPDAKGDGPGVQHVWVSRHRERRRIDLNDVERFSAEGPYVRLRLNEAVTYLQRGALQALANRLDPARFVRVHRSHIIRIDQVRLIRRTPAGGSEIVLNSGTLVPIGRTYAKDARRRILEAPGTLALAPLTASFPG